MLKLKLVEREEIILFKAFVMLTTVVLHGTKNLTVSVNTGLPGARNLTTLVKTGLHEAPL